MPPRKFSHSSMSTYRRCRYRYFLSYILDYVTPSGLGQNRGSVGHAGLAKWYGLGCDEEADSAAMAVASQMYCDKEIETGESLEEDWQLMSIILPRYFDWARANDNFAEILSLEQKFEVKIGDHTVIGYIDGVVKTNAGSIWLLEHKFNKTVSTNHIDLDPQMSLYMLAARKLGIDARGVLFNVIRVAAGGIAAKQPVERRQVFRNQEGLDFIEKEVAIQLDEMQAFHDKGGAIYRNETGNCSWDCGFYAACQMINDDGDAQTALAKFPIVHKVDIAESDKGESV